MLFINHITQKVKKYFLFISIFFFTVSFSHIFYTYIYSNANIIPLAWWAISEGIIWEFPHFNPLIQSTDYNKYIINTLYRSLLKYDYRQDKIVSDLASCDIKNLLYIECYLEDNLKWSDGTPLTIEDVKMTYDVLLNNPEINPVIASLLKDANITTKENMITFSSEKSDVNFLNVLLQSIVPSKILNTLTLEELQSKFPTSWWVYSGYFKLWSIGNDETLWIKRVILEKNLQYTDNNFLIDKLIIKVFTDINHFLKHKDSVNIFNDKSSLVGNTIPRLNAYEYMLPQYISIFMNVDKIDDKDLRTFLLDKVNRENIIKVLWEKNYSPVNNPYMSETKIDKSVNLKNIDQILAKKGYYKQAELIENFIKNADKNTATWVTESTWSIEEVKPSLNLDEPLSVIVSPTTKKYNFVTEDDILLKWDVKDSQVEAVYVNDYKLQWFKQWDNVFYYRLKKEDFESIKIWENVYKIFFEKKGNKQQVDELYYYLLWSNEEIEKQKEILLAPPKKEVVVANNIKETKSLRDELTEESKEKLKKLETLNDKFFYNENAEVYTLQLLYLDTDSNMNVVSENIKQSFSQFWINVEAVPVSISELNTMLQSWEKNYDMLLAWINLWYSDYNIFPYFHSSQIKNGYNFSNFKKLSFDIILEELKVNTLSKEKIVELEEKALETLKDESIVKTLYTPVLRQLVDKNIKNYSYTRYLKDDSLRIDSLQWVYLLEKKIINSEGKSISNFIKFLFSNLF